jgi:hypothetical protein
MNICGEEGFILYNPEKVAKGIDISYKQGEIKLVGLYLSLLTTNKEIDDFYDLIMHLCYLWNTVSFIQNDIEYHVEDIPTLRQDIK